MDRKEFLAALGIGAAALACAQCFAGCQSINGGPAAPTNVNFTLELTDPANGVLTTTGGYLYKDGIIVAHLANGSHVALSQVCTHQGGTVQYIASANLFHCPVHGSNFSTNGSVLNGPAGSPLVKYNTSLTGTSLWVYS
jgi:cytochrome b6-f complex iron-sulfur subunit